MANFLLATHFSLKYAIALHMVIKSARILIMRKKVGLLTFTSLLPLDKKRARTMQIDVVAVAMQLVSHCLNQTVELAPYEGLLVDARPVQLATNDCNLSLQALRVHTQAEHILGLDVLVELRGMFQATEVQA